VVSRKDRRLEIMASCPMSVAPILGIWLRMVSMTSSWRRTGSPPVFEQVPIPEPRRERICAASRFVVNSMPYEPPRELRRRPSWQCRMRPSAIAGAAELSDDRSRSVFGWTNSAARDPGRPTTLWGHSRGPAQCRRHGPAQPDQPSTPLPQRCPDPRARSSRDSPLACARPVCRRAERRDRRGSQALTGTAERHQRT
jgi:hypothetical protein